MAEPEREERREIRSSEFPLADDMAGMPVRPVAMDRIRWSSVIAGFFAFMSTMAVLTVLGVAVGASAFDVGDRARSFGLGAGIWGIISALIAFLIGGWLAARTSAVRGRYNGLLNGAMVWVLTIPLIMYWFIGGVGAVLGTASEAAMRAGQAAITTQGGAAQPSVAGGATQTATPGQTQTGQTAQNMTEKAKAAIAGQATPDKAEHVASTTAKSAWSLFITLILGLIIAGLGGWLGARRLWTETPVTRVRTA